jgi:hypothetical protein
MKKITEKLIVTGVVRLAYPNLYRPRPNNMDTSKPDEYGVVVLFPKENCEYQPNAEAEIQDLQLFMKSVAVAKWGASPGKVSYALKDGDVETNNDGEPRHPGYWYLRCNAPCKFPSGDDFKPTIIDGSKRVLTEGGKSGDWGCVSMSVFAYENAGKKGISVRLAGVQLLYDGDRIGAAIDASSAFDEVANAHQIKPDTAVSVEEAPYNPFEDQ